MDLLIDIGNSRIKWAFSGAGKLGQHGSAERGTGLPEQAQSTWLNSTKPKGVIAANVAGDDYAEQLNQWVHNNWQLQVDYIKVNPHGFDLELAYADPERLGVDRWLALIAARQLEKGMVAIIDAGTAMTLDVVSSQGQHLGGIIVPGLNLMSAALMQKTAGIAHDQQQMYVDSSTLFGADTRSCIEKGSLYAVTGAIEHLLYRFAAQNEFGVSVILCGGDAEQVMAEINIECQHIPDLVLQGMQIVKGAS